MNIVDKCSYYLSSVDNFIHFRLTKEFTELSTNPVQNVRLLTNSPTNPAPVSQPSDGLRPLLLGAGSPVDFAVEWMVEISGAQGTIYEGEVFTLRFRYDVYSLSLSLSNINRLITMSRLLFVGFLRNIRWIHLKLFLLENLLFIRMCIRMDIFVYQFYTKVIELIND